jgi:hypothetical protein
LPQRGQHLGRGAGGRLFADGCGHGHLIAKFLDVS